MAGHLNSLTNREESLFTKVVAQVRCHDETIHFLVMVSTMRSRSAAE